MATATLAATATMTRAPTRTPLPSATATRTSTATPVPPPPRILGSPRTSVVGASSARIEWTTNVPTTSQVEFGTTPVFGSTTGIDVGLATSHAVTVRGLTSGTLYFFRVNSTDGSDRTVISPDGLFATLPRGGVAPIDDALARRVTATTALIEWTASSAIAQVEYGLTAAYGRNTLLQTFPATTQEMLLTDLRPATVYHFRIKTWAASGATTVSEDFTFTTAPAHTATLLGDRVVHDARYSLAFGQLKAFQFAAQASGLATLVPVYVDAATSATSLSVGLYTDRAGRPGTLLAQAMIPKLTPGEWNWPACADKCRARDNILAGGAQSDGWLRHARGSRRQWAGLELAQRPARPHVIACELGIGGSAAGWGGIGLCAADRARRDGDSARGWGQHQRPDDHQRHGRR